MHQCETKTLAKTSRWQAVLAVMFEAIAAAARATAAPASKA